MKTTRRIIIKEVSLSLTSLIIFIGYIAGIVIAKGFTSTLFSILFFPYAWYLVIEKVMIFNGWL